MGDVIDLHGKLKPGNQAFVTCPCKPEGTAMLAVSIVGTPSFVAMLVCPECDAEVPVVNGNIQHPDGR